MRTYYLTQASNSLIEMRQTRFKEELLATGKEHPHDVCAIAHNKEKLKSMLESVKIPINDVDWGSLP